MAQALGVQPDSIQATRHASRGAGLVWLCFVTLMVLALAAAHAWLERRLVRKLFAHDTGEGPNCAAINTALLVINGECGSHTFCAEQTSTVPFRGQQISLAWGQVGSLGTFRWGPAWRSTKCFFALAEPAQVDWMKAQPDAFTPVYQGASYSVFIVRTSALKAELRV